MIPELSGNPCGERPTQVVDELLRLAKFFDSEPFNDAFDKLLPDLCPCCVQALLEDAAAMVTAYASTPEGKKLDE